MHHMQSYYELPTETHFLSRIYLLSIYELSGVSVRKLDASKIAVAMTIVTRSTVIDPNLIV